MGDLSEVDELIRRYHLAAAEFVKGDPEPYKALFSQRDDVTLANPFGPVRRGWAQAAEYMTRAAANWRDGVVIGFERMATCVTPELAYIVEVERFEARIGGRDEVGPVTLRTTSIMRPEDGVWRIVHRHADPIASDRAAESVVQPEGG
jgi:ketosteroid isomerase-like protein